MLDFKYENRNAGALSPSLLLQHCECLCSQSCSLGRTDRCQTRKIWKKLSPVCFLYRTQSLKAQQRKSHILSEVWKACVCVKFGFLQLPRLEDEQSSGPAVPSFSKSGWNVKLYQAPRPDITYWLPGGKKMFYCSIMSARGPIPFALTIAKSLGKSHANRTSEVHKENAKELRHPKESSLQHETDPLTSRH